MATPTMETLANSYLSHILNQPLVQLAGRALRFAFGWTVIAAVVITLIVLFSYFYHDPAEVPDWKENNLNMGFYAMLLSCLNGFLTYLYFSIGSKRALKRSAKEQFFPTLFSHLRWVLALPLVLFIFFDLIIFYHELIEEITQVLGL